MNAPRSHNGADEQLDVGVCLDRVLASAEFARAGRARKLLSYLMDARTPEHSWRANERMIGMEVFGRGEDFEPAIDPCVRVSMNRLRSKLETYYEKTGKADPIRIEVPKGGYLLQVIRAPQKAQELNRRVTDLPRLDKRAANSLSSGESNARKKYVPYLLMLATCVLVFIALILLFPHVTNRLNKGSQPNRSSDQRVEPR